MEGGASFAYCKARRKFRLVSTGWICNKNLAPFSKPPMDDNLTPAPKKSPFSKRFVLGAWVGLLLALPSLLQSQTATPETQPSPGQKASPTASTTPLIPQTEEKNPSQPSPPVSPTESTAQPTPPALPAESPSPAQPAAAPVSPLIPPAAGPGALPTPTAKPSNRKAHWPIA